MGTFTIVNALIALVILVAPIVVLIFLLVWVYRIKENSEHQVAQNKHIIELLKRQLIENQK
ncbi:hypothetical protein [Paraliobacillus ryukyuensis]|uniref:hypothetical protein n=1 Tax=Paraliobacillus ryukyuensis TaxID=200904 RepID=UPI0009A55F66|nr:hypothetical protein [Paraliobacillus ryukyuensis]